MEVNLLCIRICYIMVIIIVHAIHSITAIWNIHKYVAITFNRNDLLLVPVFGQFRLRAFIRNEIMIGLTICDHWSPLSSCWLIYQLCRDDKENDLIYIAHKTKRLTLTFRPQMHKNPFEVNCAWLLVIAAQKWSSAAVVVTIALCVWFKTVIIYPVIEIHGILPLSSCRLSARVARAWTCEINSSIIPQ